MRLVEPSSGKPSDDLDGLLRTFFRSQMPQPWPSAQVPRAAVLPLRRPQTNSRSLIRGRWALAASVTLLLLGSLLLPSRFSQNPPVPPSLDAPGTAGRDILPGVRKGYKLHESREHPQPIQDEDAQFPDLDDPGMQFDR